MEKLINPVDGSESFHWKNMIIIDPVPSTGRWMVQINYPCFKRTEIKSKSFSTVREAFLKAVFR